MCAAKLRILAAVLVLAATAAWAADAPAPLLAAGHPVAWWFVFKLNSKAFPGCGPGASRACPFGGTPQEYNTFGQQFVYASNENATLRQGGGCAGETTTDPLGATFGQIYNGDWNYVTWNDQFYDDPRIKGCTGDCGAPWGHSKGLLAWNDDGEGVVLQVSTPSWPASANARNPRRTDGNTLGCVDDNNVEVSQHFFALKVTKDDVVKILTAMQNASVVTDPKNPQIVKNGGPADIQKLVKTLGVRSKSAVASRDELSSGVELISKPSGLHVPPWQMVSSFLQGASLRTATWWMKPAIDSTTAATKISCWSNTLGKPGPVEIALTGQWEGHVIGLRGGGGPDFNHAKIGISTSGTGHYAIFGDMNQQGALSGPNCDSSQNGRGGLFYAIDNEAMAASIAGLIRGDSAPIANGAN